MATEKSTGFPQFECIISHTMEDLDSEVDQFFILKNELASDLAKLRFQDKDWMQNYQQMLQYLHDLVDSIIEFTNPPSHKFLIDLSLGEELENDTVLRLMNAENSLVVDVTAAALKVDKLAFWYVRNGKNSKFATAFTPERFRGLPFLRLALVYRSINLARKSSAQ